MGKRLKRQATLKDIARITGYSVNTVSRALRGKDDISETTIEKIKKVANELGYVNNTIASSLRSGYTNTLALILGDISNPHFAIMAKEIENYAVSKGYLAFVLNSNEEKKLEREAIHIALHKNVDGIIICPTQVDEENICLLKESGVPFIQIGRRSQTEASYVVCDDVKGGYLAAKYLLDNGHRRILFLNGPEYISSAAERRQGYEKAYREQGLEPDERLIRTVSLSDDNTDLVLEQAFEEKLEFTAIFAFSDSIAWKAWSWLYEHGYRVPEEYSIVGFDHIQSKMAIPFPLTTISSYKTQMSLTAVDCMIKMIKSGSGEISFQNVIGTKLVKGSTVKRIGAAVPE